MIRDLVTEDPMIRQLVAEQLVAGGHVVPRLPTTLAKLNAIFAPYDASFSHAWGFNEASGNAADLAISGAVPLAPDSSPTQGVSTGLIGGDKGVQFSDGSNNTMQAGAAGDLDITTGSVMLLLTLTVPGLAGTTRSLAGKGAAGAFWYLQFSTSGHPIWQLYDGAVNPVPVISVDHSGAAYFDLLAVLDRTSADKRATLTSNLGDSGLSGSLAGMTNSMESANKFGIGTVPGLMNPPACTVAFGAYGTVPGTLVANRVAALAAWRSARGA